ncbi:alpha/beta hydrolase fold domain-containing protein [Microbacterium protaetiae]|nr:alpha/beta hydrolase fold domain-containing protein [Microbacterium protaetiae]
MTDNAATIETSDTALRAADHDFTVRTYPAPTPNGTMLVWAHGGAFVFGELAMPEADLTARELAARGTTVVSVDYTLAPGEVISLLPAPDIEGMPTPEQLIAVGGDRPRAPFPVASLQLVAAFDWAQQNAARFGADPLRVGIGGASAGGNLAGGAALRLRDRGTSPARTVLVYPVLHATVPAPDAELAAIIAQLPAGMGFPPEITKALNENYLGGHSAADPYAFPGGHDLTGLTPTLVITAHQDELRPSGEAYAAELEVAGVVAQLVDEPNMHGFLNAPGDPSAVRSYDRIAAFLADEV